MENTKKIKKKKQFRLPHLLYIMLGIIFIAWAATYIIPAGNFGKTPDGKIDGTVFNYLGQQTPVSLSRLLFMFMEGMMNSSIVIFIVLMTGANLGVILETGAVDEFLNWSIYKLRNKSASVLVPMIFILMVYLGAFGGSDALIAIVPIGILFAKKLKLDPICGLLTTFLPSMIGFGTGPTKPMVPQMMMGVPLFSGFGFRMISMNLFMLIGLFFTMRYINKITKDPTKSVMGNTDWLSEENNEDLEIKEVHLSIRSILVLVILITQYLVMVWYSLVIKERVFEFNFGFFIFTTILAGFVGGMKADDIGNAFAKGLGDLAFVVFIIGLASVVSLLLKEGNIIDTIVYNITRPLMGLNRGLSAIGIDVVITIINPIIPSATSKAAILMPIIQPVTDALGMHPQIAVQAFQYGDGFTNLISPALGWTMGSLTMAKVPYNKWVKWIIVPLITFVIVGFILMYVIVQIGWTGL